MAIQVRSFAHGRWIAPGPGARPVASAVTGEVVAEVGDAGPNFEAMLAHAMDVGGPALRALTFHQRARMLKALAQRLNERKDPLYELSFDTGATRKDHLIDIDGGIGTLFVFSSKGRRELPDSHVHLDGPVERLSREGSFLGRHVATPLGGVAVQINAFNFPVWGMLEKLAPALLAGMPAIVKPATASCYVAEAAVRTIVDSGILPDGALQMIAGGTGDLLDRLGGQDVVSFTGSAETASKLRSNPRLVAASTRFIAEQDSLNASILGPDAAPGTEEFEMFVEEAHREMTAKAGQKCTAIRRMLTPEALTEQVAEALGAKLAATRIGDPRLETSDMGALISSEHRAEVLARAELIGAEAERAFGGPEAPEVDGAHPEKGAFMAPTLFLCSDPDSARHAHETEAFGPVATVMPYRDIAHAVELAKRGQGSLVASLFTHATETAREVALGVASHHGRLYVNDRDSRKEATGHGSPLPHMVHGGPGRAGGGEELGGIRGVMHYMQRTAIQGSPEMLSAIGGAWVPGAAASERPEHPFRRRFDELAIGETLRAGPRVVELDDIDHFAEFTGDTFYAHMDEEAAAANPFFPGRVAHGYLLLSFAAGMFVDPAPGPVLANYGLDGLRFLKPVSPGDAISVRLTAMGKTPRNEEYGEVRWHVLLTNQDAEPVAEYELLTMVARRIP